MPQRSTLIALTLVALAASASAAGARAQGGASPLPGLWEYTSTGFGSGDPERHCLTAADVAKLFEGFSNRHYACEYPVRETKGGRWRFEGQCTSRKHPGQKAGVELAGTYAPEAFTLKGHVSPTVIAGLTLPIAASIEARRIAPTCTAADEGKGG